MLKNIVKTQLIFAAALLISTSAFAEESTTLKVQNGVTVKSGSPSSLPTPANSTEEKKPVPEKLFMKPIVENTPAKTPSTTKFTAEKKETTTTTPASAKEPAKETPFKKSQDAGVKETVKKPDPTPEVKSESLVKKDAKKDDISDDIKKLEESKAIDSGIGESGLPIPRFVSLKSGEANARTGPGDTYPIRWVYQRKHLPVEITAEFKLWRRIKDFDGEQSWVHQALLSSNRYAILNRDAVATNKEDGSGDQVARFKKGVQVKVAECKGAYCEVEYGRIEGWVKRKELWGIYADEVIEN